MELLAELGVLPPAAPLRSATPADPSELSGRVRLVVLPDDTFEYHLTIVRAEGVTFTTGELVRASPDVWGDPVATLFSDVSLSGPYVQLRGTGRVARTLQAGVLLDEIRESPGAFAVRIRGESGRPAVLAGLLR